ncbi:MAG TPA: TetR/AcrR family transcriptional regulator [Candidatus Limiplasma sp.]|nr:TetR/AcrR family transcriptional regulator [Candidatus Limiplasma sp.]
MPQILKKEIKNKILQSALNSFLEKGYRNTSMQEIAQNAGIAAGNIYNYFKNKEEVFSTLIHPVLTRVKEIFAIQSKDLPMLNTEDRMGIAQRRMEEFIQVYQSNRKVFVLLFEKSDSTKFETTKADVEDSFAAAIIHAKNDFTSNAATQEQQMLIKAFASAYVSGIISILTEKTDEALKLNVLQEFLPFMRTKLSDSLR